MEFWKNILKERLKDSDIGWAFRKLKPLETYNIGSEKSLQDLCEDVLFLIIEQDTAKSKYEDRHIVTSQIKYFMEEMQCSYNQPLIRCLGIVFSKLLKRFYSGVLVNDKSLKKVKCELGAVPVILLPSHRSYCDFIIMAYVFFAFEIEIPCVAAAMDFSSMKVIGNIMRQCKAFFIRRNFNTDFQYKNIFQRFLQYLVIHGNSPVEFFIEGTRSRSGKALPPKFGLLKTILDTFTENDVPDLMLIPVGISYDRVVEDVLFSYELLGVPKPPESTKGFFKAISTMDEKYGNIYVNMGEPIFVKSLLTNHFLPTGASESSYFLEFVGYSVIKEQQKLQNILCIHLLSLVLHEEYMKNGYSSIHFTSACSHIKELKYVLEVFGANVYLQGSITDSLNESLTIHKSLITFSDDNVIKLSTVDLKLTEFEGKLLKGATLCEDVLNDSISILYIQQYINPLFSVLASPVVLITLLQCYSSHDVLLAKFIFVRNIFSYEFIFLKEFDEREFKNSVDYLLKLDMVEVINENIALRRNNKYLFTLSTIFYPFILTYLCTCEILLDTSEKRTLENIYKSTQLVIGGRIKNRYEYHHSSLSLDSIGLAVTTLIKLGVISKTNNGDFYLITNNELLQHIFVELGILLKSFDFYWKNGNMSRSVPQCKL